ncbi:hypothetical protein FA727_23680, partial [Robertmurraya kyonggiensis]
NETIKKFGFKENIEDNCVFAKFKKGKYIFLVLYVDDILLASNDISLLLETKKFLSSNFDMKDLGEASFVLGIEIHRDRRNGVLGLSQKTYLEKILERYNMQKSNPTPAPIVKGDRFGKFQCPQNEYERQQMKAVPYSSALGSLSYAQTCTRPDLAFVTNVLSRYQEEPGIEHWKLVKKAFRYVQGTKGLMLTYRRSDSLEIKGYADADYAGDEDDRKSTTGYIFMLAEGAISWRSSKQPVTASSTMYAEFIACYEASTQVEWLKKFVPDLRIVDSIERPLKMYCDNQPAVFYAHNNKRSTATKPIQVRFYSIKDRIQDHTISLEHMRSKNMLADPLTKGLPPNVFKEHLAGMGLRESL